MLFAVSGMLVPPNAASSTTITEPETVSFSARVLDVPFGKATVNAADRCPTAEGFVVTVTVQSTVKSLF